MKKREGAPQRSAKPALTGEDRANANDLLVKAKRAGAAGRSDDARRLCAASLALARNNPAARHFMGTLAWAAGDRAAAVDHVRAAVKLAPKAYVIRLDFARMLMLSGKGRRARRESAEALALRPNDVQARFEHAKILYNSGQPLDAEPHLEAIAAGRPDVAEAHAMLAALRMESSRVESALESTDRAIAAGLESADLDEIRGRALFALSRPEGAAEAFRRVLSSQPDRLLALRGLSNSNARIGNREVAQQAARSHAKILPYEKVGRDEARLRVLVSEGLGPSGAFYQNNLRVVYAASSYISSLDHPEVQRIHYLAEYADPRDVLNGIGGAQLLFNNESNAEVAALSGQGEKLARSHAETRLPVINPVDKVMMTSREENYRRLKDDPAYLFPRTIRFDVDDDPEGAARSMLSAFDPPFLVRPITTNLRGGLRLIRSEAELLEAPGLQTGRSYYAIDYYKSIMKTPVDGEEGAFQFRASVVGGQIVPDRIVWGPGDFTPATVDRSAVDYDGRGLTDYEREFLKSPESILGAPLESIFANLVKTVGLDVFGIDFGLMEDGRIIVFETNASMNLFNPKYEDYAPWRREHRANFHDMVVGHFDKRIAAGPISPKTV